MEFYGELAKYYDLIYANKDYKDEAVKLHSIIQQYKQSSGKSLLEVACGTGSHIEYFKDMYEVVGLDINEEMLKVARSKYRDIEFIQGDMVSMNIGRRFDIITCLFGSISHLPDDLSLNDAVAAFSSHLVDGGLLVIEPFLLPEDVKLPHVSMNYVDEPDLKLARINNVYYEGDHLILNFHFLIGTYDDVKHIQDPNRMRLFAISEFEDAFRRNGLEPTHVTSEWARSGHMVGRKQFGV
ncbi:MAG: class I SAM-dependent methyltransferase [Candidatus Thorarchaeota archaeon]